jgi:Zn-dependent M28 family amino/carboxypeptidase
MNRPALRRTATAALAALAAALAGAGAVPGEEPMDDAAALLAQVSRERLEEDVRRLAAFGTRHTASSSDDPARGIGAARRWLRERLEAAAKGTTAAVEERSFVAPPSPRLKDPTEVVNVLLRIPGRDPAARARTCVVTAHYDSRATEVRDATGDAPGANDDGSGTALVLELARVLASRPRRATVLLGCVGGEEQGLLGSRQLAKELRQEGTNVEAMLTNDIVGNSRAPDGTRVRDRVRVFSEGLPRGEPATTRDTRLAMGGEADGPSRQLARFVREAQRRRLPAFRAVLVLRPDRFLRGGDHLPFNEEGFAAIRLTEAVEDWDRQHQDVRREGDREYGDLPDAMDFDYLANVTRLNLAAVVALADAPGAPRSPRVKAFRLEATTTLTWEAPGEEPVAGYEVVWRDTEAADWEHAFDAGPKLEATVPVSKDDVHFGVRSYDASGRRSLVAYPFPSR